MKRLTIAIVTRHRAEKLKRCLMSLISQTDQNFEVLVVDNDTARGAQIITKHLSSRLSLRYVVESKVGVPFARNKAIKNCNTRYLAFIDDDCEVDSQWTAVANKLVAQKKPSNCGFYLGRCELWNMDSVVALASHVRAAYWKKKVVTKNSQISAHAVDTKNIVLDMRILEKYKLKFDPQIFLDWYDSADTDLGLQLEKAGLIGIYVPKLIIYHEEDRNYFKYAKKAFARGRLAYRLIVKWQLENQLLDFSLSIWLSKSLYQKIRERRYWWRHWQREYRNYLPFIKHTSRPKRWLVFLLIKMYDKNFLDGYSYQISQQA